MSHLSHRHGQTRLTEGGLLTAIRASRDCHVIPPLDDVIAVQASREENSTEPSVVYCEIPNTDLRHYVPVFLEEGTLVKTRYHFAMTGKTLGLLQQHRPGLLAELVKRTTVFARMEPESRMQLTNILHDSGHTVAICSDQANAGRSSKEAYLSMSLRHPEQSVMPSVTQAEASSVMSSNSSVTCILDLIRQARCSLLFRMSVIKHMFASSWLLAFSVFILYYNLSAFSSNQYYYIEMLIAFAVPVFAAANYGRVKVLEETAPRQILVEIRTFFSVGMFVIVQALTMTSGLFYLWTQPWFDRFSPMEQSEYNVEHTRTLVFQMYSLSIMHSAIVFSKVEPHRRSRRSNVLLAILLILLGLAVFLCVPYPISLSITIFKLKAAPHFGFGVNVLLISMLGLLVSLMVEEIFIGLWLGQRLNCDPTELGISYQNLALDGAVAPKRNTTFVSREPEGILVDLDA